MRQLRTGELDGITFAFRPKTRRKRYKYNQWRIQRGECGHGPHQVSRKTLVHSNEEINVILGNIIHIKCPPSTPNVWIRHCRLYAVLS